MEDYNTKSILMSIHLVICYECDKVMSVGLSKFFYQDGTFSMPKVAIEDCGKCRGHNSKFMFTIEGMFNE